jgi:hypothetical protein
MPIKKLNRYLLITTICLLCFLLVIIFFYVFEKNIMVQYFLNNIQYKLEKHKEKYSSIINKNYSISNSNEIIIVNDFLQNQYFKYIRSQFNNEKFESRDFFLRKATGINFFNLHKEKYDGILEIYYSNEILSILGNILKKPIQRISLGDPNACSLLIYTNKGDHIDWHLDYSNYYGDRYVVLFTIINENETHDDLSDNLFQYNSNGKVHNLKVNENSLIIFKGSEILHKSTAIKENERRILLSMVFCDVCQEKKMYLILFMKNQKIIFYMGNKVNIYLLKIFNISLLKEYSFYL